MFNCEMCGKTSKPGDKLHKVVMETRDRVYNSGPIAGYGKEIVKEKNACAVCAGVALPEPPAIESAIANENQVIPKEV